MVKPTSHRLIGLNPEILGHESSVINIIEKLDINFAQAATSRNIEFIVFGRNALKQHKHLPFPVFPCLSEPSEGRTDSSHLVKQWRSSRHFCNEIFRTYKKLCDADSRSYINTFFMYHAHARHIAPAIRLGLRLKGKHPIILNLYWLHFLYGTGQSESSAILRRFLIRTKALRKQANVHLIVDSDRLANHLEKDLREPFQVLPFFAPAAGNKVTLPTSSSDDSSTKRLAFPTFTVSNSKGTNLVYNLARRMQDQPVEFITRYIEDSRGKDELLPDVRNLKNVKTKQAYLSDDDYHSILEHCHVVLIPYRTRLFYSRTSGVFSDAIYFGKPIVATANTWVGKQVARYGCGKTFIDGDIESFHTAVTELLADLEHYQNIVLEMREAWLQENNPGKAVEFLINYAVMTQRNRTPNWLWAFRRWKMDYLIDNLTPFIERDLIPLAWKIRRWGKILTLRPSGIIRVIPRDQEKITDLNAMARGPIIEIEVRSVKIIEVRLDSPNGPLIYHGPPVKSILCSPIVYDNIFYLQDASDTNAISAKNTLYSAHCWPRPQSIYHMLLRTRKAKNAARFFFHKWLGKPCGNLKISPNAAVIGSSDSASIILSWDFAYTRLVEIRLNSPDGTLVARTTGKGEILTTPWIKEGMRFFMQNALATEPSSSASTLHALTVNTYNPSSCPTDELHIRMSMKQASPKGIYLEEASSQDANPDDVIAADEWGVVPLTNTGEVYFTCLAARAFIQKYGGKRLVLFVPEYLQEVVKLFEDHPIRTENSNLYHIDTNALATTPIIGHIFKWAYLPVRGPNYFIHNYTNQKSLAFTRIYLESIGLDWPSSLQGIPSTPNSIVRSAKNRMIQLGAKPGRTAIIAPHTNTVPRLPDSFWIALVQILLGKGMVVCTNLGPGEKIIPGTLALHCPLSEIPAIAEFASFIFTGRSGLVDLLSNVNVPQNVIHSEAYLPILPGVHIAYSLQENGLPDNTINHYYNSKMSDHRCAAEIVDRAGI